VASVDWDIPQKLRLGTYEIRSKIKGSEETQRREQATGFSAWPPW
jgi:hypothetical protein